MWGRRVSLPKSCAPWRELLERLNCRRLLGSLLLPLASVLPQGIPGCLLHVTPDVLGADLPVAGAVTTALPIPNVVSLIGQGFRHQVVLFEFGGTGAITAASSSNALQLTIGAW